MKSAVMTGDAEWSDLTWRRKIEILGARDGPTLATDAGGEVDSICQPGELTDKGRETTLSLGTRTRGLYVDQLGFLPTALDANTMSALRLRSTPIPRALESVQQTFTGLYPASSRAQGLAPPTVFTRAFSDETLFPNEGGCKRFAELARAFADRTALKWKGSKELEYLNKKIGKYMPSESPVIAVDSHPRLSGIMDTINSTLAHGPKTKLPSDFYDPKVLAAVDRICTEEWFVGYTESNEYRKLGIGGLVGDITQIMVQSATGTGEGQVKLGMAGCHDTTLAATLTALGAFGGCGANETWNNWPPYTSSMAFELFKHKTASSSTPATSPSGTVWPSQQRTWWQSLFGASTPSSAAAAASTRQPLQEMSAAEKSKLEGYYVRLRYNDRPMTIPGCKAAGKHLEGDESFCTLEAFKEVADSFTPRNWKEECKQNLGALTVPERRELPFGVMEGE